MRNEIWNSMLDAEMNYRYWSYISKSYHKMERNFKFFLAIMTSGTVASWGFWGEIEIVWKILSGTSAVVAIIMPIIDLPKLIKNMSQISQKWFQLKIDYEILWLSLKNNKNQATIEKEYKRIKENEKRSIQPDANLPRDEKLIQKCFNEVLIAKGLK